MKEKPVDRKWSFGAEGLEFSPLEGFDLRLGGRIHYDIAQFDSDATDIDDEAEPRRVRVSLAGNVRDDWKFYVERDEGGKFEGWKEMFLRYKGIKGLELTAGNQVAPFSLEENTSSDDTIFLERALPNALSAGLYVGIAARRYTDNWSIAAGYFEDTIDNEPKKQSEGHGVVSRVTYAPIRGKKELVHVGASLEYRDVDAGSRYRIRSRPEVGITDVRLVDTRRILDVNDTWTYSLEAASTLGPLSAQGEFIRSTLERDSIDVRFEGWYLQASYLLTGEHHDYSARGGRLQSIQPSSRWGAVEIAARWSNLDLSDEDILGGEQADLTFGLNWYVNANLRCMVDYGFIKADPNRDGIDEEPEVLQFRLQVTF